MSAPVISPPAKPITLPQAKADLIESIALEETALAHIINAEGEKIQKVLASNPTIPQLLQVNEAVADLLKVIVKKEIILQFKLEAALAIPSPPHPTTTEPTTP